MTTEKIEVHLITIAVTDHERLGIEAIRAIMEQDTPLFVNVIADLTRVIDYTDDHPINQTATAKQAVVDLFNIV